MTKFILFSITTLILWITTPNNPKPKEKNPTSLTQEKQYTVTQSLPEWQAVLFSINNPDDISPNQRKEIVGKLVNQLNKQIQDSLPKKK
jgi:hypothetical protein